MLEKMCSITTTLDKKYLKISIEKDVSGLLIQTFTNVIENIAKWTCTAISILT